jgi:hypothetical protein
MGQGLTLVGCGDSWAWGTELIAQKIDPLTYTFDLQNTKENIRYREDNRYLKLFADKIGANKFVDLSKGGISNDTILRSLMRWLANQGYTTGRDTSNLFVSIGWTSPERKDFHFKKNIGFGDAATGWFTVYPLWTHDYGHPELEEFFQMYVNNFWNAEEYMHRWITQVWITEMFLKQLGIKYIMHQAFYHLKGHLISKWNDEEFINDHREAINFGDVKLWEGVDPVRFVHKDDKNIGTFHHYILNYVGKKNLEEVFAISHPNAYGHKIWADHLYNYCVENKLL